MLLKRNRREIKEKSIEIKKKDEGKRERGRKKSRTEMGNEKRKR